jgi:hypothetical protein
MKKLFTILSIFTLAFGSVILSSTGNLIPVNEANATTANVAYIDASGNPQTLNDAMKLTDEFATINGGWYYVASGEHVDFPDGLTINGDVKIILEDGSELTATGTQCDLSGWPLPDCEPQYRPGIRVQDSNSLTIFGQTNQTGKLGAQGGQQSGAGIGAGNNGASGDIAIYGGIIRAGGINGAGIGGGYRSLIGNITIGGGTVTAYGGESAAGIGGGWEEATSVGTISIFGSATVSAYGNYNAAGIGGGYLNSNGTVNISGGNVLAVGGSDGAGIGGGSWANAGTINISGGNIIATGGATAAGIGGGGYGGNGGTIVINDGIITATGGDNAPGIGAGQNGANGSTAINGGVLEVISGTGGPAGGFSGTPVIDGAIVNGVLVGDHLNGGVPVTDITTALSTKTLNIGNTYSIVYSLTPTSPSLSDVVFSSSDDDIVTVSTAGVVTAQALGDATITVTSVSNPDKYASVDVTVTASYVPPAPRQIATPTVAKTVVWNNGKALTPTVTLKDGATKLTKGTHYTATYTANKNVGTAKIVVRGKGNYTGTKTITFKILPAKLAIKKATAGKKKITVTWNKKAKFGATKVAISYKLKSASNWTIKYVALSKGKYTIKNLKKGKRYQVKIAGAKDSTFIGAYSTILSVTPAKTGIQLW